MTEIAKLKRRGRIKRSSPRLERIREAMSAKGFNQSDLARATGIHISSITRIMAGAKIDFSKAELISKALKLPLGEFGPSKDGCFVTKAPLADGAVQFQANLIVKEGVQIALHALILFDQQISPQRLAHLLRALHEPSA